MIRRTILGLCIILLFSNMCIALEFGYPFDGRIVGENNSGIENLSLKFIFYGEGFTCETISLSTIHTGDFFLTLNDRYEIIYNDNDISCISKVVPGMKASIMLNRSSMNCSKEVVYYDNFSIGYSDTSVGTYRIKDCVLEEHITYNPSSGGGGGGGSSPEKKDKERMIIMTPEEADDFLKRIEEEEEISEDIVESVDEEEMPRLQMPSIRINWDEITPFNLFRVSLIIILIANLSILTMLLRKGLKD